MDARPVGISGGLSPCRAGPGRRGDGWRPGPHGGSEHRGPDRARPPPLHRLSLSVRDHVRPDHCRSGRRDRTRQKERERMIPVGYFFGLSIVLFVLGIIGFFVKRDLITMFMAVEVMLNAANLAFIALAKAAGSPHAQVLAVFVITVAAAEAAVGLAIILLVFRQKKSIKAEH